MSQAEKLRSVARGIEVSWRDEDMTGWTDPIRAAADYIERLEERAEKMENALEDILFYDGGADSALEDQYVMERAHEAFSTSAEGEGL